MVDPRDVLQGPVGRHLQPQAHHLIDELPAVAPEEHPVAVPVQAVRQLLLPQQLHAPQGVRRQHRRLRVQQHLQQRQEKYGSRPVALCPGVEALPGEHQIPGKIVGEGQPPLLRHRGQLRQPGRGQLQHLGAGDALSVQQAGKALQVVLLLQKPGQLLPPVPQVVGGGLGGEPPQQAGAHLPDPFFVHGWSPFPLQARSYMVHYAPIFFGMQHENAPARRFPGQGMKTPVHIPGRIR